MKNILMTNVGFKKLKKKLNYLINIVRPKIIKEIIEARAHGDLKENSEYHSAKEQQSFIENKIKQFELKLSFAKIIDITKIPNNGTVLFGSTITILNLNKKKKITYRIVCDYESNIKKKLISVNSPIASNLIGSKINDIVFIKTPLKEIKYKILKIEHI
ncbi:transcription elongation factor GreA [Enterobacteriaceae bacterium ET-AT1-13]|nr:transcription elongation factor GreA [Enterobacteriaceae bacterium ET-AT1-13]WGS66426.1 transcription elongation factor GreA [Enterobacteriaceae bacterium Cmel17]WMC17450.1 MAG: transcription elongation factor GreA [Enterobacteriaceae bacterium Cmel21]WMC17657.1 MAG: transcription elongation factor GreA [Enterobacteriaceae bacterium PSmelAO3-2]WMC17861.1 MAG: transcription elongation factor GreA [Enterobacteriaceae bacterium PSmelAO3-1]WMC18065.1 MAG: transcription elongation factor GreA [E